MVEAGAASALPTCVISTDVCPLRVVPKNHSNKLCLIVNMSMSIRTSQRESFKFEGLSNITDMPEKGDFSLSYDLTSGYYHAALHPEFLCFVGFKWKGIYY